jgi:hypothetical protein
VKRHIPAYLRRLAVSVAAVGVWATIIEAADPRFVAIDEHVTAIERPASGNIVEFVQRLVEPARNDLERVRAIAWWMATHITYDHDMQRVGVPMQKAGRPPVEAIAANKPPEVMRRGKAVCSGYAALFVVCCKTLDIEAVEIGGSTRYNDLGHAWNAVQINGKWQLLDISYMASGAGNVATGQGRPLDFYFLTPPERLIFSHFPQEQKWQLLPQPVSRQDFESVPVVPPALLMIIAQPQQLRQAARRGVREFVPAAFNESLKILLLDAPLERTLEPGRSCRFRIQAENCTAVYLNNGGKVEPLRKHGSVFQGQVTPDGDFLRIGVELQDKPGGVAGILDYAVATAASTRKPPAGTARIDDEIARLINEARVQAGAKPLNRDPMLDKSATAHAAEMARQRGAPPREACLVAAIDTPAGGVTAGLGSQLIGSMMEQNDRRSWACAAVHGRIGVGVIEKDGRVYFCMEFR